MARKRKLSPEAAALAIRAIINAGDATNAQEAVDLLPDLEVGVQLFEQGSAQTASRGSGAVAATPPDF